MRGVPLSNCGVAWGLPAPVTLLPPARLARSLSDGGRGRTPKASPGAPLPVVELRPGRAGAVAFVPRVGSLSDSGDPVPVAAGPDDPAAPPVLPAPPLPPPEPPPPPPPPP